MSHIERNAQIEEYLHQNMAHYMAMLRQMVKVNSFTANAAGVNALGQLTADLFAPLGFTAEMIPSNNPDFGSHLVLTRPGSSEATIGMVSHLDTVFPPEEEIRNGFHWREAGERIYGPGTVDIKGGTVVMYMILDGLRKVVPQVFTAVNWVLLLDASEENGGEDFGALCIERLAGIETRACLIFEGGSMRGDTFQVVVARKGMAIFEIEVEGKASHAGSAHPQGANAIVQLAETIQKVAAVTDYERDVTVNVGTVRGGTVTNRVPHQASAELEMRAFTMETYETAVANILKQGGTGSVTNDAGDFACQVNITQTRKTVPWPRNPQTDHLLAVWQAAGAELGYMVLPEERGGLSDGNYFWYELPSLDGLGPSGGNAHCSERSSDGSKDQEYCDVTSFVPKALLNTVAILRLVEEV